MTRLPARWVLASGNAGKYAEFRRLLAPAGIELASQRDFDLESPEETGHSFVENALLKARHAAAATGMPSIADDSGLAVDALGGAPGIRSARFADGGQGANNARLLHLLEDVPEPRRGARFCCVVVALRRWDDPTWWRGARFCCVVVALRRWDDPMPLIGTGEWHGRIVREPRGASGFGYDPVFFDPELGATAAELPAEVKNRVSHRGRALAQIEKALRARSEST